MKFKLLWQCVRVFVRVLSEGIGGMWFKGVVFSYCINLNGSSAFFYLCPVRNFCFSDVDIIWMFGLFLVFRCFFSILDLVWTLLILFYCSYLSLHACCFVMLRWRKSEFGAECCCQNVWLVTACQYFTQRRFNNAVIGMARQITHWCLSTFGSWIRAMQKLG